MKYCYWDLLKIIFGIAILVVRGQSKCSDSKNIGTEFFVILEDVDIFDEPSQNYFTIKRKNTYKNSNITIQVKISIAGQSHKISHIKNLDANTLSKQQIYVSDVVSALSINNAKSLNFNSRIILIHTSEPILIYHVQIENKKLYPCTHIYPIYPISSFGTAYRLVMGQQNTKTPLLRDGDQMTQVDERFSVKIVNLHNSTNRVKITFPNDLYGSEIEFMYNKAKLVNNEVIIMDPSTFIEIFINGADASGLLILSHRSVGIFTSNLLTLVQFNMTNFMDRRATTCLKKKQLLSESTLAGREFYVFKPISERILQSYDVFVKVVTTHITNEETMLKVSDNKREYNIHISTKISTKIKFEPSIVPLDDYSGVRIFSDKDILVSLVFQRKLNQHVQSNNFIKYVDQINTINIPPKSKLLNSYIYLIPGAHDIKHISYIFATIHKDYLNSLKINNNPVLTHPDVAYITDAHQEDSMSTVSIRVDTNKFYIIEADESFSSYFTAYSNATKALVSYAGELCSHPFEYESGMNEQEVDEINENESINESTYGREFVISVPISNCYFGDNVPFLELQINRNNKSQVKLKIKVYVGVKDDSHLEYYELDTENVIKFDKSYLLKGQGVIRNKAIWINANEPISITVMPCRRNSGYLALPVESLSNRYVAVTDWPNYKIQTIRNNICFITIIATEKTRISVLFPTIELFAMLHNGRTYESGDVINISLNKGEIFHIENVRELTGTIIKSLKNTKIAVISGNLIRSDEYKSFFTSYVNRMLILQNHPTSSWGKEFLFPAPRILHSESTLVENTYEILIVSNSLKTKGNMVIMTNNNRTNYNFVIDGSRMHYRVIMNINNDIVQIKTNSSVVVILFEHNAGYDEYKPKKRGGISSPIRHSFSKSVLPIIASEQWKTSYIFESYSKTNNFVIVCKSEKNIPKIYIKSNGINNPLLQQNWIRTNVNNEVILVYHYKNSGLVLIYSSDGTKFMVYYTVISKDYLSLPIAHNLKTINVQKKYNPDWHSPLEVAPKAQFQNLKYSNYFKYDGTNEGSYFTVILSSQSETESNMISDGFLKFTTMQRGVVNIKVWMNEYEASKTLVSSFNGPGSHTFKIPSFMKSESFKKSGIYNAKTVYIHTSHFVNLVFYKITKPKYGIATNSTEGSASYLILPTYSLGTRNVAATVEVINVKNDRAFMMLSNVNNKPTDLGSNDLNVQENTGINVVQIRFSLPKGRFVDINGRKYENGDEYIVNLYDKNMIFITADSILSGTLIVSLRPIILISGNYRLKLKKDIDERSSDEMLTQPLPLYAWGRNYAVGSLKLENQNEIYGKGWDKLDYTSYDVMITTDGSIAVDVDIYNKNVNGKMVRWKRLTIKKGISVCIIHVAEKTYIYIEASYSIMIMQHIIWIPSKPDKFRFSSVLIAPIEQWTSSHMTSYPPDVLSNIHQFISIYTFSKKTLDDFKKKCLPTCPDNYSPPHIDLNCYYTNNHLMDDGNYSIIDRNCTNSKNFLSSVSSIVTVNINSKKIDNNDVSKHFDTVISLKSSNNDKFFVVSISIDPDNHCSAHPTGMYIRFPYDGPATTVPYTSTTTTLKTVDTTIKIEKNCYNDKNLECLNRGECKEIKGEYICYCSMEYVIIKGMEILYKGDRCTDQHARSIIVDKKPPKLPILIISILALLLLIILLAIIILFCLKRQRNNKKKKLNQKYISTVQKYHNVEKPRMIIPTYSVPTMHSTYQPYTINDKCRLQLYNNKTGTLPCRIHKNNLINTRNV
ncbi:hypothetical protein A3Q56_03471 [Intoshia linei]|uniref:IgGFc-binding protein N-terminal domain-containing protein n=1 Tax=Intoshia linei TaxID=1819745 RepID=A0A177B3C9_9BILA|nr:hypothetical protein A3Q56_03471 [Intoshia linei]